MIGAAHTLPEANEQVKRVCAGMYWLLRAAPRAMPCVT